MTNDPAEGVPADKHRPLYIIAGEIGRDWMRPSLHALPYLYAMRHLNQISEMYGADTASSVVAYFLSNATHWRGDNARRIKAELKAILKGAGYGL